MSRTRIFALTLLAMLAFPRNSLLCAMAFDYKKCEVPIVDACGQLRLSYRASVLSAARSDNVSHVGSRIEDAMASTALLASRSNPDGRRIIDKEYRGVRICIRLGAITQEETEQCLLAEIIIEIPSWGWMLTPLDEARDA